MCFAFPRSWLVFVIVCLNARMFMCSCAYLLDTLVCSNACMLCNQVSFILAVLKCFTYIQHCVFFVLVFFINLTFQGEKTCSLPGSKTNIFCWIFNKIFVSSLTCRLIINTSLYKVGNL